MSLLSDIALAIKTKLGGTSTNNTIPRYDGTTCTLKKSDVTISDTNVVTAGGGFVGNLTGTASNATLAASATKLETARTINGVPFNGTANITIADSTKAPLTGGGTSGTWGISITGNASTANNAALAANATKLATERFINGVAFDGTANITIADNTKAPLTGAGASGTWGINVTGNSATTTKLATARTIGGVSFDGTSNINLPGVNTAGNQNTTGNSATATKLATPVKINNKLFDGSTNINLEEDAMVVKEKIVNLTGDTIQTSLGSVFIKTITKNTTLSLTTNYNIGEINSFILELTNGGNYTINWWNNIEWNGGVAPKLTNNGKDILGFYSYGSPRVTIGVVLSKDAK